MSTSFSFLIGYQQRSFARHRSRLAQLRNLRCADADWFIRQPGRIVRFRPERKADFSLLPASTTPPTFVPHQLDADGPLIWVAVIDILRAADLPALPGQGVLRSRVRTVPIRSRRLQLCLEEEFAIAVCSELLARQQHPSLRSVLAA